MGGRYGEVLSTAFDAAHVVGVTDVQALGQLFLGQAASSAHLRNATTEGTKNIGALHPRTSRRPRSCVTTHREVCVTLAGWSR
jgi:hypothetical protein